MIYLKNIREKQTVYIPRTEINSKVVVIKSYDEGYADGIVEGKKLQKLKLTNLTVSENGVYKREDGWNEVEVDVPEIAFETQEKNITVSKDVTVVQPDSGYDGITKVTVNATQYGQTKYNDGAKAQKNKLTNLSVTSNGTYNRADGWNEINVNVPSQTLNLQEKNITLTKDIETVTPSTGYDGLTKVGIDATFYAKTKRDEGYTEGHLQGKTEGYENGKADGIEEGYANGYADGKAEGGDITLTTLIDTPKWEYRNPDNNVTYNPSDYNADGFSTVSIKVDVLYNQGKSEGVEEGYQSGYTEGKEDGIEEGYSTGKSDGYAEGYEVGKAEGENTPTKINMEEYNLKFMYSKITEVPEWADWSGITNMRDMFNSCYYLKNIPSIDTSNVTNMAYMFYRSGVTSIEPLDISNVKELEYMFYNCGIKTAPLLNSTITPANSAKYMFYNCQSLESIPALNLSNVENAESMFHNCEKITEIPSLNLNSLTCTRYMFFNCRNLKKVAPMNTSKVTDMECMFFECFNIWQIPELDVTNVVNMDFFFTPGLLSAFSSFGGFKNLKINFTGRHGLKNAPNLTYESCMNVLNGLYDFTGNGETPTSSQGNLQVHEKFLTTVGDQISIATNKGWTIIV